jgi:opacity protein-like surface antigen
MRIRNKMKKHANIRFFSGIILFILFGSMILSGAPKEYTTDSSQNQAFSFFVGGGYKSFMPAADTFKTLYDSSGAPVFSAGMKYDLDGSFFLGVEAGYISKSGERVWVASDGTVIKTGIAEDLNIIPLTATLGYYFVRYGDVRVYAGAGGGLYLVKINCEVDIYDRSESGFGFFGALGAEFNLSEAIYLTIEGRYDSVTGLIGDSGVPALFGENDLGGLSGMMKIGFKI